MGYAVPDIAHGIKIIRVDMLLVVFAVIKIVQHNQIGKGQHLDDIPDRKVILVLLYQPGSIGCLLPLNLSCQPWLFFEQLCHNGIAILTLVFLQGCQQIDFGKMLHIHHDREHNAPQIHIQQGQLLEIGKIQVNVLPHPVTLAVFVIIIGIKLQAKIISMVRQKLLGLFLINHLKGNSL